MCRNDLSLYFTLIFIYSYHDISYLAGVAAESLENLRACSRRNSTYQNSIHILYQNDLSKLWYLNKVRFTNSGKKVSCLCTPEKLHNHRDLTLNAL